MQIQIIERGAVERMNFFVSLFCLENYYVSLLVQRKISRWHFSKCEAKFQKEYKGSYDFLKNLDRPQSEELKEISRLAPPFVIRATRVCRKALVCAKISWKNFLMEWSPLIRPGLKPFLNLLVLGGASPMIPSPPPPPLLRSIFTRKSAQKFIHTLSKWWRK